MFNITLTTTENPRTVKATTEFKNQEAYYLMSSDENGIFSENNVLELRSTPPEIKERLLDELGKAVAAEYL